MDVPTWATVPGKVMVVGDTWDAVVGAENMVPQIDVVFPVAAVAGDAAAMSATMARTQAPM
ncbi:MAG: hypothetical protein ABSB36_10145 [Candidatus Dormibacteria bacterium]